MSVYVARHYQPHVRDLSREETHWFHIVQKQRLRDINRYFMSNDVDPNCLNTGGVTALGLAAQLGYTEVIDLLLQHGVDVNRPDFYGLTALHYSAEYGKIRVMKHLIRAGAKVNNSDKDNSVLTPVHIATCAGMREAVQALIESKCNVNAKDINGTSVLMCGVSNGMYKIVEDLLDAGADINYRGTFKQKSALHMASELGDVKMLTLLLEYRPKLQLTDAYGMTPLCSVSYQGNFEVADILLKSGARVNIADDKKTLPLHYAARNGNLKLAEELIRRGSKIDVLNQYFESPLHLAVRMARVEIIKSLINYGCDAKICQQYTHVMPLHIAVNSYTDTALFEEVLLLLIQGGADLNSRAFTSLETPLFRAVGEGKVEIARTLVKHGADCSISSMYDLTILQKACRKTLVDFIDLLLTSGVINWSQETWLNIGAWDSGINKELLLNNCEHDIPLSLHGKLDLYFIILEARQTPLTLSRCCRLSIRKALSSKLYMKVGQLGLPKKLQDFIMMEII